MKNMILKPVLDTVRRWYIPLIIGIFFIAAALFGLIFPHTSFLTLAIFFSLSFLLSGISEIIFSLSNTQTLNNWGWYLALGILTAVVGLILLANPNLTATILAFFVGFTFLFRAISTISLSLDIKNYGIKNWGYLLGIGILGVIISILLIAKPMIVGISLVILMALAFLILGIFNVYLAFQLKKIHKYTNKIKPELIEKLKKLKAEIYDNWRDISDD